MGLGFPTLVPNNGVVAMSVADAIGVQLAGLMFDAGPELAGTAAGRHRPPQSDQDDPTSLQDVFFRIGGATAGKATISLVVQRQRDY